MKKENKETENTKEKTVKKLSHPEYEKKIIEFAKNGLTSEKIGEKLRQEKIYTDDYREKISKVLKENNLYTNPDLKNTEEKLGKLKSHSEKNRKDKRAMREVTRISAKVRKMKKYLKIPAR